MNKPRVVNATRFFSISLAIGKEFKQNYRFMTLVLLVIKSLRLKQFLFINILSVKIIKVFILIKVCKPN